jgi:hypothetical protein
MLLVSSEACYIIGEQSILESYLLVDAELKKRGGG